MFIAFRHIAKIKHFDYACFDINIFVTAINMNNDKVTVLFHVIFSTMFANITHYLISGLFIYKQ